MHNCSQNIGIDNKCIRPIHTLEKNVIHIGYSRSYPFTLNHFLLLGEQIGEFARGRYHYRYGPVKNTTEQFEL